MWPRSLRSLLEQDPTSLFNIVLGILYVDAKMFRGLLYSVVRDENVFAREFSMRILRTRDSRSGISFALYTFLPRDLPTITYLSLLHVSLLLHVKMVAD